MFLRWNLRKLVHHRQGFFQMWTNNNIQEKNVLLLKNLGILGVF